MNRIFITIILFLTGCAFAQEPDVHLKYNYQSTEKIPIKLTAKEKINSEKEVYEGQQLDFTVKSNVYYNNNIVIAKDTPVSARVETIIKSGMNGIPASIIIGNFKIENIEKGKISDFCEIEGQNRSLWVFPLKWALTPVPPTGSLTNFIKGGHAKLNTDDIVEIYYYPEWF